MGGCAERHEMTVHKYLGKCLRRATSLSLYLSQLIGTYLTGFSINQQAEHLNVTRTVRFSLYLSRDNFLSDVAAPQKKFRKGPGLCLRRV